MCRTKVRAALWASAIVSLTAVAVAAPAASAQVIDRVKVGVPARNVTAGFSPALSVTVLAPPHHRRGCCYDGDSGQWLGPEYWASKNPNLRGTASISWSVRFDDRPASAEAAARSVLIQKWPEYQKAPLRLPHVIRGRRVGTIPGYFVLTASQASGPTSAQHEAAVAFALGRGVYATASFSLLSPSQDYPAPFGEYIVHTYGLIKGETLASSWNREQAFLSVVSVGLSGNLPPARVLARGGKRVTGSVRDRFGHPLVLAPVTLEQKVGKRWLKVHSAKTNAKGAYVLRSKGQGLYRVVARLGVTQSCCSKLTAATARSKVFRVR